MASHPSSSESEASSDDDLLSSPVFARRDRRTERADKTKLDFLGACLRGSSSRIDVHKRIADADREYQEEEEEGEGGEEGEGEGVDGGAPEAIKEEEGDAGDGPDGADGRIGSATRGDGNADDGANDDDEGDGVGGKESVADAPRTAPKATPAADPKPPSAAARARREDEDAYWSRVDSFASRHAPSDRTPAAVASVAHAARRRVADVSAGLMDGCDSDGGASSDRTDDGGAGTARREQRRGEAEAREQGGSSHLGLRKAFAARERAGAGGDAWGALGGRKKKKEGRPGPSSGTREGGRALTGFRSKEEAIEGLRAIVASMQKTCRNPKSPADATLRKRLIEPLAKISKRPGDQPWDCLCSLLRGPNSALSGRYALTVPGPFCGWMWRMAVSPFGVGGHCADDCCRCLRRALANAGEADGATKENARRCFGADLLFLGDLEAGDLAERLEDDFGLCMGPMPTPEAEGGGDDGHMNGGDMEDKGNAKGKGARKSKKDAPPTVDVRALKNLFLLWTTLLRRDLVRIDGPEDGASRSLSALARAGLDPRLCAADERDANTCGEPLPSALRALTSSLVDATARGMRSRGAEEDGGGGSVERWTERVAIDLAEACGGLGPGDEGAADADDEEGRLALAMAVKRMSSGPSKDGTFSMDVALFKLAFAVRVLRMCLKKDEEGQEEEEEEDGWEDGVEERVEELSKDWAAGRAEASASGTGGGEGCLKRRAVRALATAEAGLRSVDDEREAFFRNQPRLLAAVVAAGECASVATSVFFRDGCSGAPGDDGDDGHGESQRIESERYAHTSQEKDALHDVASSIEDLCDSIRKAKEFRAVMVHPHLQRTKECLTRLGKQLAGTKGRSSKRQRRSQQGSLDSYFSRPSMSQSDPFADSQDS
ncbi:hypothetical protein ACHAWF_011764 [Thalassiosira exigua]